MDQFNEESNRMDWTGGPDPESPSDPIARNDKDVDQPEGVQPAQVSRRRGANQGRENVPAVIDQAQTPEASGEPAVPAQPTVPAPPAGPTSSDRTWGLGTRIQATPSPAELVASMLRFKWTILIISIVMFIPLAAVIWTQIIPKYRARAEVRVRPVIPRLVFKTDENGMIPLYGSFVNTQVSLIRGPTVLQRVLDQQEVRETRWYRNPSMSLMEQLRGRTLPPIERLRDGLSVMPRRGTEIIDISFTDPVVKDARLIVDAVLDQYITYVAEKSDAAEDTLYRQLIEQYKALENEIQGREKICAELHKTLGTELPQELIAAKRLRLDEAQARLTEVRNVIAILQWRMERGGAEGSDDMLALSGDTTERQPLYYEDAEWRRLELDVKRIQHQITNGVYTANHPMAIRMQKDLEFAEELLRAREAQLDEQWHNRPNHTGAAWAGSAGGEGFRGDLESLPLEEQLARVKREEQLLQADLTAQETEFKRLFEIAQSLERENSTLRQKRDLFDAVRQRLDQKNMERSVPGSIEVLTRAFSSSQPEQDRRIVFTAMALFVSLGTGCGTAFLRANRSQAIYAPKDMPQAMQTPFLGHVPLVRTRKPLGRSLCEEITQKQFLLVESVRLVRTALLSRLNGQRTTAILITSATPGTGKSNFTMILGRSLAQSGKKVLMIDVDFYKKTLSKRFDVLDKPGLLNCLGSKSLDTGHVFPTETPGLCIMPAGKRSDDGMAFEEIANGAFKNYMNQLSKQCNYDIVLLDSSPILLGADATILANQVDGTIMVEREHVSRRSNVMSALTRLNCAGGRLLGTVFIGSGGDDGYGYAYGYDRYRQRARRS